MNAFSTACRLSALIMVAVAGGCQSQGARQRSAVSRIQMSKSAESSTFMPNGMAKMDRDMMAAPMTGDPDHDFAAIMIPHHQGAVEMARKYLPHATNPVLRSVAETIVHEQPQEIARMQAVLLKQAPSSSTLEKRDFDAAFMQLMVRMDLQMSAAPATNNVDRDFALMMIPHHRGTINMARLYLDDDKDGSMRDFAAGMIQTQLREIDLMQRELDTIAMNKSPHDPAE